MSHPTTLPLYLWSAADRRRRINFGPHVFLDRSRDARVVRTMYIQMRRFGMAPSQVRSLIIAGALCTVVAS